MIMAGDFRKGITVEIDGNVWTVVDFQHVKPGKGAAFVRTKLKNVMTGAVLERTFNPSDKYPKAHIETKEMQYLYNDGDLWNPASGSHGAGPDGPGADRDRAAVWPYGRPDPSPAGNCPAPGNLPLLCIAGREEGSGKADPGI